MQSQILTVQYQPTASQPADLLTKPLPRAAFELHSAVVMGMHPDFRMGISKLREYPLELSHLPAT